MFITLEGIEGAGKTSRLPEIKALLQAAGHEVVETREPGATPIGGRIRSILLDPDARDMAPLCELLLYAADRAQHLNQVVAPALAAGKVVLCDRFADATRVYQGCARKLSSHDIETLHHMVVGQLTPDLTILFDLDPAVGLDRSFRALAAGDRDAQESRFEQEALAFHAAVRQGYLDLADREPERFLVVDAALPPEGVLTQIKEGLWSRLRIRS